VLRKRYKSPDDLETRTTEVTAGQAASTHKIN
jgi:hypothetical protein